MTSPIYTLNSSSQFWNDLNSIANSTYEFPVSGNVNNVSYTISGPPITTSSNGIYLFSIKATYNGKTYNYQGAFNYNTEAMSISDPETGLILNEPVYIFT